MNTNPELELANMLIGQTSTNIFLTGKAGTGKTTFLKILVKESPQANDYIGSDRNCCY